LRRGGGRLGPLAHLGFERAETIAEIGQRLIGLRRGRGRPGGGFLGTGGGTLGQGLRRLQTLRDLPLLTFHGSDARLDALRGVRRRQAAEPLLDLREAGVVLRRLRAPGLERPDQPGSHEAAEQACARKAAIARRRPTCRRGGRRPVGS
jgi:hypothetical protein